MVVSVSKLACSMLQSLLKHYDESDRNFSSRKHVCCIHAHITLTHMNKGDKDNETKCAATATISTFSFSSSDIARKLRENTGPQPGLPTTSSAAGRRWRLQHRTWGACNKMNNKPKCWPPASWPPAEQLIKGICYNGGDLQMKKNRKHEPWIQ